jgi:phage tail-like protein
VANSSTAPLLRAFRFQVHLLKSPFVEAGRDDRALSDLDLLGGERLADGAFQECTGLDVEMDVQEYLEGGRNDGVIRRVGRAKYQSLVLKRGMFYAGGAVNGDLWAWFQAVVSGIQPVPRYDGIVEVMSVGDTVVARWGFERGLPQKITGPQLNARTGEVAIEELHIAHEGLALLPGPGGADVGIGVGLSLGIDVEASASLSVGGGLSASAGVSASAGIGIG